MGQQACVLAYRKQLLYRLSGPPNYELLSVQAPSTAAAASAVAARITTAPYQDRRFCRTVASKSWLWPVLRQLGPSLRDAMTTTTMMMRTLALLTHQRSARSGDPPLCSSCRLFKPNRSSSSCSNNSNSSTSTSSSSPTVMASSDQRPPSDLPAAVPATRMAYQQQRRRWNLVDSPHVLSSRKARLLPTVPRFQQSRRRQDQSARSCSARTLSELRRRLRPILRTAARAPGRGCLNVRHPLRRHQRPFE
mmetsp:Transcript_58137/g.127563  ORF Transcript_58137/g.127563 Transcript_58137/m.127563 type:complete len:249 (+) Transcript_58137:794-1540(+)